MPLIRCGLGWDILTHSPVFHVLGRLALLFVQRSFVSTVLQQN